MLKVRTLFSGIGSPERALKDLQIPYELVDFCEVDKYAVKSYCSVHGVSEEKNLGDITKVWGRNLPYADLLVWGFPCQDISVAGKQKGLKEGETRSGLYYEGFRILKETKPKYSIIENVKNLTGKKFKADFESMLDDIESLGYNSYWKVLNAKDYGIPQNRERVFIVSIRKNIDTGTFSFPKGFDNGLRLKDFLENEVDEKYYINQEKTEELINQFINGEIKKMNTHPSGKGMNGNVVNSEIANTLTTNKGEGPKYCIPCITPDRVNKRQNGRRFKEDGESMFTLTSQDRRGILQIGKLNSSQDGIVHDINGISQCLSAGHGNTPKILRYERTDYGKEIRKQYENGEIQERIGNMRELRPREDGISNTLTTVQKDNLLLEPRVAVKEATKKGYAEATIGDSINIQFPNSETRRGRVGVGVAQTLETACNQATLTSDYRIRKLTPKECWRLMGFTDEDFQKAKDAGISNTQLYKQAGNSIVTNVLFYIFKNLLQVEIAAIYEENKELS
ncbi:DNA (cytosine-5-)-methyltransferase [Clostridium botulinum]|uniref:DNA (cytosine-5-)-methyltransferase n=1 Tax=Clostridium botulinum TaxID=1491 RepID=UPI002207E7FC|nr:DNA (cytosine-5-)-methyltransferase [Clostridium botulinum]QDY21053.1 DNA (cytosine-5-)-methyltransferase [Clostridium botulinum]